MSRITLTTDSLFNQCKLAMCIQAGTAAHEHLARIYRLTVRPHVRILSKRDIIYRTNRSAHAHPRILHVSIQRSVLVLYISLSNVTRVFLDSSAVRHEAGRKSLDVIRGLDMPDVITSKSLLYRAGGERICLANVQKRMPRSVLAFARLSHPSVVGQKVKSIKDKM